VAASVHGYKLRRWRYGPNTDTLVREALERDYWAADQWSDWRSARLRMLLRRAVERVPYYRELWSTRGGPEDYERLENWPILDKEIVRANPKAFLADDCDYRRMVPDHTSGSTGTPLHLWWSHATTRAWYGLFEARWRRWYGVGRLDRWGILGGQRVVPAGRRKPPFWVWNAGLNQLYMSAYHMSRDSMPEYLDAIRRRRLRFLWGYTSALFQLACFANESGISIPLQVVITNAEPLYGFQKEAISRAFQCPVRETYGMAEIVAAASECEQGRLHLWPEVGIVEVMEQGSPVPAGAPGELVATGIINIDMPLIRYRTGDRLALEPEDRTCACGRLLPLARAVEGRTDDVVVTSDGRLLGRLDPLFKAGLPIREAQIIQRRLGHLEVRFVPAGEFTAGHLQALQNRFHDFLGPMELTFLSTDEIPKNQNGKFRSVISTVKGSQPNAGGLPAD
jgi:phenylacetate-CoA ligase